MLLGLHDAVGTLIVSSKPLWPSAKNYIWTKFKLYKVGLVDL